MIKVLQNFAIEYLRYQPGLRQKSRMRMQNENLNYAVFIVLTKTEH